MKQKIVFGGIDSSDYNVYISGQDVFSAPERDVEYVSVAGRNGDLILDNGRWKNITVTYPAFIAREFENKIDDFRASMMLKTGYQKLEDTYHPNEYRMATFIGGLSPSNITALRRDGEFSLTFNCKPQRFLKSGDTPIQVIYAIRNGTDSWTSFVPVDGDLKFTASTASPLSVTVYTYNASGTQLSSTPYTCADGVENTKTFSSTDKYWRIKIEDMSIDSDDYLTIVGNTTYNGTTIPLDAKFGVNYWIDNESKYPARPLIEFYSTHLPTCGIVNYENNVDTTGWSFWSDAMSNGETHGFFDCELQYLYDADLHNQTNTLHMTQSGQYNPFTFPVMEGDKTNFYCYDTTEPQISSGIGLILLYPRWWTL